MRVEVAIETFKTRRSMSSTQMIIVAVLSIAVVALLMVRQRQQTN